MEALQLALHFTVLHRNPIWTEETRNQKGWQTATSDNSTIHFWPVDVDGEGVALRTGFMVQVLIGGYTLTSEVEIPPQRNSTCHMASASMERFLTRYGECSTETSTPLMRSSRPGCQPQSAGSRRPGVTPRVSTSVSGS